MFNFDIKITNFRFVIKDELYFSKYFNIKLRNPNVEETKKLTDDILDSVNEIIKRSNEDTINKLFSIYRRNQYIDELIRKINPNDINLYFELLHLFNIVNIYNRELKIKKDNFKFNHKNIYKAINNFVKKMVLIDLTNRNKIDNLIRSYYNLNTLEDFHNDYFIIFYNGLINLYNKLYPSPDNTEYAFFHTINIGPDLYRNISSITDTSTLKISKEKEKLFKNSISYNLFDVFLESSNNNPKIFIFLTELFANSSIGRTDFLNYITFFDLILTHKPNANKFNIEESISQQFIQKISACISLVGDIKTDQELTWLKSELKLIYNYRSDILHGDFNKTTEDLEKFFNIPYYNKKTKEQEYLRKSLAIEQCVLERLNYFFQVIFKMAAEEPFFIKALK